MARIGSFRVTGEATSLVRILYVTHQETSAIVPTQIVGSWGSDSMNQSTTQEELTSEEAASSVGDLSLTGVTVMAEKHQ